MTKFRRIDVPQADTLKLVASLIALAAHGYDTRLALSQELPLVEREVEYYMQAARILGFADYDTRHGVAFTLTERAERFLRKETAPERKAVLAAAVREVPVIKELLSRYPARKLDTALVIEFLREVTDPPLQHQTAGRRAQTILRWLKSTT